MVSVSDRPDVLRLLKQDHDEVRGLFQKIEKAKGQQAKRLLGRLRQELEVHSRVEEEIVYPAYRKAVGDRESKVLVQESLTEHHLVDVLLQEMESPRAGSPEFEGRVSVLKESVEHHAEEEEKNMFPRFRKACSKEQRVRLGERVMQRKKELQAQASGRPLREGPPKRATAEPTKQELYQQAQKKGISGRSEMSKQELMQALR